MPQITLEYSSNISSEVNFKNMLLEIHRNVSQIINCDILNCKSRVTKLDSFLIGEGDLNNAMIHLAVAILDGRTEEVKTELGEKILSILEAYFAGVSGLKIQITVEVKDLQRKFYFKKKMDT